MKIQKKIKRNKIRNGREEITSILQRYKKNHKRLGTVIVCQEIGQPRRKKFLETFNLPGLNQEETDSLKKLISSTEIEKLQNKTKSPANTSPNSHSFTGKFKQPYKEFIYISYLKKKKKTEEARTLPNSFYEANITQIPSQTRTYKNENDRPISLRDTEFLNSQQSISKPNSTKNQDFMPLSSEI